MGLNIRQTNYYVGVDLGQSFDPTAIVVLERQWGYPSQNDGVHDLNTPLTFYRVRHMERLPLGMDYVQQVQYIGSLMRRAPLNTVGAELLIDFTGVGRPVFDIFHEHGIRAEGVNITAGNQETQEMHGWNVAKQILVSTVQAELHSGRLKVNKNLKDAPILERELQDFQVSITPSGNATFSARVGRHDDLVLALAIALWRAVTAFGDKVQRVPFTCGS
jgi:hypothetical protein